MVTTTFPSLKQLTMMTFLSSSPKALMAATSQA
jgi:hypothetical protein